MPGYAFHPDARHDLADIWDFIAAENVDAADRVIAEVLAACRLLADVPGAGHRRGDLTSGPLRFKRVRDYLIAYAPDEQPLVIIAVLHGRRNPRVMAAVLRGRE